MHQHSAAAGAIKPRKKTPRKITPDYLHNSGLAYLQRFASSTGNFRSVMMRKVDRSCRAHPEQDREACAEMVEDLIAKFLRAGLLDDTGYVRGAVGSLRRRGLSSRAIQARLAAKRLDASLVAGALTEHETDDFMAALRLAQRKRIGPFSAHPDRDEGQRNREMAALGRAGYDYGIVMKLLSMTAEEALSTLEAAD